MNEDITPEVKQAIIEQRIAIWRNTAFQAEVDYRVARRVDDKDLMTAAKANIVKAEQMIAGFNLELEALKNGEVKP